MSAINFLGSLIYNRDGDNLTLESTGFGGGRIVASESTGGITYSTNYQITDHLGSVRVVFNDKNHVISRNDFYPFGKRHSNNLLLTSNESTNRWQFNGKEKQIFGSLGYLDFGARMNDSEIGRWFVGDPLLEKYYGWSPYNYALNNPIRFIDPDGRSPATAVAKGVKYGVKYGKKAYRAVRRWIKELMP